MNNKIIWIVNQHAVLPNSFGGTRHYDLAESLGKFKFTFYVITAGFSNFEKQEKVDYGNSFYKVQSVTDSLKFIWIKIPSYKSNGFKRLRGSFIFAKLLKGLVTKIPKPDLIIGSSPQLLSSYQSLNIAKSLKVPFVFEVRDIWPLSLIDLGLHKYNPLIIFFEVLEKRLMKYSHHIIAVMPMLTKYASDKFKIDSDKITWISNSFNDRNLKKFESPPKKRDFIITYTGTIGLAQDTQTIIQAVGKLREVPNLKIILVGDGVDRNNCVKLTKSLGLEKIVIFRKPVPKNKVLNILKKSDALIVSLKNPSAYSFGCQPNKLFDYLGAGRPMIIASSAGNNPIESAGCDISVKSGSVDKLADAILQMYNMPQRQKDVMGKNALKYLKKHYLTSIWSEKLRKLIDQLT